MEFLSDEVKRKRTVRLFLGYGLIAVLIGLATLLLVYMAQGYNYNLDDGVVRNGLVFVDSKPVAADIYIDGQSKGSTDARIALNEGQHEVTLKKDKYRNWNKTFNLEGGAVLYLLYPRLIPTDIAVGVTKVFDTPPAWTSQSPDRRWLIMQQNAASPVLTIIDLNDPTKEPFLSTLPAAQLAGSGSQLGALTPVEWSSDNQHLLLKQNLNGGGYSYVVFDRDNSDNSVNISLKYNLPASGQISLRDEKYDKYYYYEPLKQELTRLDLQDNVVGVPILTNVVAFNAMADDLVLYVTYANADIAEANVYVLSGQKDKYRLKSLPRDSQQLYLLDMVQYDHSWYYLTTTPSANQVLLYRNPLKRASTGNTEAISPQMSLELANPQYLGFSTNARFISMQSGKNFVVYDGEQNKTYRFVSTLNITAGQQAKWIDGYHLGVVTDGKVSVFEFDGANTQELTDSRPEFLAYFDPNYEFVYTLIQQVDGKTGFASGQLFAN